MKELFARHKNSSYYLFPREVLYTRDIYSYKDKSRKYTKGLGTTPHPNILKRKLRHSAGIKSLKGAIDYYQMGNSFRY